MSTTCTRCDGTGLLNTHQIPEIDFDELDSDPDSLLKVIKDNPYTDLCVCDCCGDCEEWHGIPGEHYNDEDPQGQDGPYGYNGGLCECH
jgi:hypothetical protein